MRGKRLALPALVALVAVACGTKKSGAPGPVDYDKGSFGAPEIVFASSGSILVETTLAFAGGGEGFGAWTLCDNPGDIEDCDVGSTHGKGATGWTFERLSNDASIQYSAPSLAASGPDVQLAYSRRDYYEYDDVWERHLSSGTTFGAPLDVTTSQDASQGEGAEDFSSVAFDPAGKAWVAYVRILPGLPASYEVDVAPLSGGGAPKTAIPAKVAGGICDHPALAIDAAGQKHVLADCIDTNGYDTIFYATDGSAGTFAAPTPMPGGNGGNDNFYASLALDPDGVTLHGVWVGSPPCSASAGTCFEPYYARKDPGQPWTQPLHVAGTGNASEFEPSLAVDGAGEVLITWARAVSTSSYDADVFFTWSADGSSFSTPVNVSNTPVGDDEYSAIAVDPTTGRPHLIWVHDYDSIAHSAWSPTP